MTWLFPSCGQKIGVSASASDLPVNSQGWFPLGLPGLISLQSEGLSSVFLSGAISLLFPSSTALTNLGGVIQSKV